MRGKYLQIVTLLVIGAASYVGFLFHESNTTAERLRSELTTLSADYTLLRDNYNEAVRRTAVTELLVEEGKLSVVIRTAEGEMKRIDTPCDVAGEVYVDYVILGGRLWIRRVFDQKTPPSKAVIIDPKLADIDWSAEHAQYGKAVYRHLTDGRWMISVSGDGSLGLARVEGGNKVTLAPPPMVKDYETIK